MAKCSMTGRETQACDVGASIRTRALSGWAPMLMGMLMALSGVGCGDDGVSLEECAPATYEDDGDPATACVAWTVCLAGEYVSAAGTEDADRECAACAMGEYSVTLNAASCTPWTECVTGEYVSAAGTAASDRTCTACTSGTFAVGVDATNCTVWTECVAGEYVSTAGSASADQACTLCAPGTYTSGPNRSMCLAPTECAPGTVQTAPATMTMPTVCAACSVGQYCAGGEVAAVACDDGDDTWDHDGSPATACVARTPCSAGTYVSAEGSATTDRSCTGCSTGSFSTTSNAASCTPWQTCAAGRYVSNTPSDTVDQVCTDCTPGTYTATANLSMCLAHGMCAAGTVQTAAGTSTLAPVCASCSLGEYCAGHTTPAVTCGGSTWDHDGSPATACATRTDCAAGQSVVSNGNATTNRTCAACVGSTYSTATNAPTCTPWAVCAAGTYVSTLGSAAINQACTPCASGQYSTAPNQTACTPWQVCVDGYVEGQAGSSTMDRACVPWAWARQFGTAASDGAYSVSVGSDGSVLVAGVSDGALPGQTSVGLQDAFVRKYDAAGVEVWTRQFGTASNDIARSVSVGGDGSVLVAGYTFGTLPGQSRAGSLDVFVRKYDAAGAELWTRQFGTTEADYAWSVSVGSDGSVLVAGSTFDTLPGQSSAGNGDVFVRKYDAAGAELWTRQFGTGGIDVARSVSVGADGSVLVAGVAGGTLPGQSIAGAFVRKYDATGAVVWTRQFGTETYAYSVSVGSDGSVLVAGSTQGTFPWQTNAGGVDAFVRKYDAAGAEVWTRQFGSSLNEEAWSVSVGIDGSVLVVGHMDVLSGSDVFLRRYSAEGAEVWTRQFGSNWVGEGSSWLYDEAWSVSVGSDGSAWVAGSTQGTLSGQSSAGDFDAFVMKLAEP